MDPINADQARLKLEQNIIQAKDNELSAAYRTINQAINMLDGEVTLLIKKKNIADFVSSVLEKQGYKVYGTKINDGVKLRIVWKKAD